MRYFIQLAYNGKLYHGWQKQPNAHSIQGELENKLAILLKAPTEIIGCGRTDTGVHAKDYYAHFESEIELDTAALVYKLNGILPKDIVVHTVFPVAADLHTRFDAKLREYEYWIATKPTPFYNELSFLYTKELDVLAMNEAAALLLSYTDFECFSKVHTDVKTFNCNISFAKWEWKEKEQLVFTIRADRFLRNMVRAIVGTLLEIGKGKLNLTDFQKILESKNRSEAGASVPAHGLFLTKVEYAFPHFKKDDSGL